MNVEDMRVKGGQSKSPAKQEAARRNGKLGGRPRMYDKNAPTLPTEGFSGNAAQRRKERRKEKK